MLSLGKIPTIRGNLGYSILWTVVPLLLAYLLIHEEVGAIGGSNSPPPTTPSDVIGTSIHSHFKKSINVTRTIILVVVILAFIAAPIVVILLLSSRAKRMHKKSQEMSKKLKDTPKPVEQDASSSKKKKETKSKNQSEDREQSASSIASQQKESNQDTSLSRASNGPKKPLVVKSDRQTVRSELETPKTVILEKVNSIKSLDVPVNSSIDNVKSKQSLLKSVKSDSEFLDAIDNKKQAVSLAKPVGPKSKQIDPELTTEESIEPRNSSVIVEKDSSVDDRSRRTVRSEFKIQQRDHVLNMGPFVEQPDSTEFKSMPTGESIKQYSSKSRPTLANTVSDKKF